MHPSFSPTSELNRLACLSERHTKADNQNHARIKTAHAHTDGPKLEGKSKEKEKWEEKKEKKKLKKPRRPIEVDMCISPSNRWPVAQLEFASARLVMSAGQCPSRQSWVNRHPENPALASAAGRHREDRTSGCTADASGGRGDAGNGTWGLGRTRGREGKGREGVT